MRQKTIEWSGAATGLAGSLLLALNIHASAWGFALFLASNLFWLAYGVRARAWGMVTMQCGYTLTSTLGIVRWFGTV
jgi:hypothetical protein